MSTKIEKKVKKKIGRPLKSDLHRKASESESLRRSSRKNTCQIYNQDLYDDDDYLEFNEDVIAFVGEEVVIGGGGSGVMGKLMKKKKRKKKLDKFKVEKTSNTNEKKVKKFRKYKKNLNVKNHRNKDKFKADSVSRVSKGKNEYVADGDADNVDGGHGGGNESDESREGGDGDDDVADEEEEEVERRVKKKRRVGVDNRGRDRGGEDDYGDECLEEEEEEQEEEQEQVGFRKERRLDRDANWIKKGGGGRSRNGGADLVPGTPKMGNNVVGMPLPEKKQVELILDKLQKKDAYGVYAEPVDEDELPDYHEVIEKPMDFGTIRKKLASGLYPTLEKLENDVFLLCSNAMQYNSSETIYHKQARSIQELAIKKFQRLRRDFERSESERKLVENSNSNSLVKKTITKPSPRKNVVDPICSDFSAGAPLATILDTSAMGNNVEAGGYEKPSIGDGTMDGSFWQTESKSEEHFSVSGKASQLKPVKKPYLIDENRRSTYIISNQLVGTTDPKFTLFDRESKQLISVGLHADHSYARSLARFAANLGPVAWKVASKKIEQALPEGIKFGHGWVGEYEPHPTSILVLQNQALKHSGINCQNKGESSREDGVAHEELKDPKSSREYRHHSTPVQTLEDHRYKDLGRNMQNTCESQEGGMHSKAFRDPHSIIQVGTRILKEGQYSDPVSDGNPSQMYQQHNPLTLSFGRIENTELNRNHARSLPFRSQQADDGATNGALSNGNSMNSLLQNCKAGISSYGYAPNQQIRTTTPVRGNHEGLSDPVQMMRMLAQKNQDHNQQSTPLDMSSRRKDPRTNAAPAWMTLGGAPPPKTQISAAFQYSTAGEFSQSPVSVMPKAHMQSENRTSPSMNTDLSRFQPVQAPWRGLSPHTQSSISRQGMLPPDLNIGVQSPGSPPVKQPRGFMQDSQQPDLALQL